jgi:signal transduction histidine kinase
MSARRRLSLRTRIVAVGLLVVVAGLTGGGLLILDVIEAEMTGQIDEALRADADFASRLMSSPEGLPVEEGPTDLYVQFVADDGRVLGAGTAAAGRPSFVDPAQATDGQIVTRTDPELGELRVLARALPANDSATMVLARSSANVTEVQQTLTRLLVVLVVAGSAALGVLIWVVVGRALRPVDEMRRRVDELDNDDLTGRLERPRTGDELDALADTLNRLLDRLDEGVAREHQFVADASHELRSPIAAMRALLETESTDPDLIVLTRADALARLTQLQDLADQLLELESTGSGPFGPVDLDELVIGQARQLARRTALHVDASAVSGGQVFGSERDLARVVENLSGNAARYATRRIEFGLRETGAAVELTVADDGPGVPEEDRLRVFERFATLDDARSPADGGTGLGLAIVAAVVIAHRGMVEVDDRPGGGARFRVTLPRVAGPEVGEDGAPPSEPAARWRAATGLAATSRS